jgi:sigma-B regulation protein RsbU (phosphoserine phosphatase)
MTRADFDALLHRHPPLGYTMARVMGERLEQAHMSNIRRLEERNRRLEQALDDLRVLQAELVERRKVEHELALARDIQVSLLPNAAPRIPGYDFGARLLPMTQVGGDFYDFISLDEDHVGVAVGGVSGHGVPAALIMAITVALLRAEACRGCSPAAVLTALNAQLLRLGADRARVTALYGTLDVRSGEFTFACAGHEPPLLIGRNEYAPFSHLEVAGGLLGLFETVSLRDATVRLAPGESLLLYTDGVIEARSPAREFFGEERLTALAAAERVLGAQALCDRVLSAVSEHTGGQPHTDDITVVAVGRV